MINDQFFLIFQKTKNRRKKNHPQLSSFPNKRKLPVMIFKLNQLCLTSEKKTKLRFYDGEALN